MLEEVWPEIGNAWVSGVLAGGGSILVQWLAPKAGQLNLGDVIVAPDDIYGHGVNVASRLESLAPPGGICISADAWRHVRGTIAAEFVDLGEQRLKNIADPAHVFAISLAA
jgi:hypothetical protein